MPSFERGEDMVLESPDQLGLERSSAVTTS